jgi:tRNA(His) 5'-end guanylyltransferase
LLPDLIPEKVVKAGDHDEACPYVDATYADSQDFPAACTCGVWTNHGKVSGMAAFDARAFNVPNLDEAANALLWREIDATRNSVSMAARHYYSHKQLHGQGRADQMDMLMAKGVNWNDYPAFFRRGTYLKRQLLEGETRPRVREMTWEPLRSYDHDARMSLLFSE